MYALRERRVHVTQEDFEMAVAKVCETSGVHPSSRLSSLTVAALYPPTKTLLFSSSGDAERQREEHVNQKAVEVKGVMYSRAQCEHVYFPPFVYALVYHCYDISKWFLQILLKGAFLFLSVASYSVLTEGRGQ